MQMILSYTAHIRIIEGISVSHFLHLLNQYKHGRILGEMIDLCSNWERFPQKHAMKASVCVRVLSETFQRGRW